MTIYELDPVFRIGPINIGEKLGRVVGVEYEYVVREEHFLNRVNGEVHYQRVIVKNPDRVRVKSGGDSRAYCDLCKRPRTLDRERINFDSTASRVVRWLEY